MLYVRTLRIKENKLDDLRDWMRELSTRVDEVRETFEREGVRHEQAHLLHTTDGALLIYAVEADDIDEALRAFESSPLPIDAQHRAVMTEVTAERLDAEMLLDIRQVDT